MDRIIGRQLARELRDDELDMISGAGTAASESYCDLNGNMRGDDCDQDMIGPDGFPLDAGTVG